MLTLIFESLAKPRVNLQNLAAEPREDVGLRAATVLVTKAGSVFRRYRSWPLKMPRCGLYKEPVGAHQTLI
jgi:hypothetical protein